MVKGGHMEKKAWTTGGEMLDVDRLAIRSIADHNLVAARIFVTGEVHESYIGEAAVRYLINFNDTFYQNGVSFEPLFTETKSGTVRMTRFAPRLVWHWFHPDKVGKLIEEEAKRLHVDVKFLEMDEFDFYQEMIRVIRKKAGVAVPIAWKDSGFDEYFNAVYLSCLLLLGKGGYLDIPVAEFFADPKVADWMATVNYRQLTAAEYGNLEILKEEYRKIYALTNPEMHFIIDLFDKKKS